MSEVISSGITITIPTLGETNWDQVIKTLCFQPISSHDHTGGGNGVQLSTNSIADGAITEAKLADDAATRSCLLIESSRSVPDGTLAIVEMARLGAASTTHVRVPKACKVTHISINSQTGRTGGTVTVTLYKNGVTTGKSVSITTNADNNSGSITAESFASGDKLSLAVSTSAVTFTVPPSILIGTAWGHFTE